MKKIILSMALLATMGATATAQDINNGTPLMPNRPLSSGELFQGMSRAIPNGRVVLPYGLDVTFDKTVHLIFPSAIRYVDLGSQNIIAGKAEDAENVLRDLCKTLPHSLSFLFLNTIGSPAVNIFGF